MVQLSGLAAHKKPRIWAWQPRKSLDYTVFIWVLAVFYVKLIFLGLISHLFRPVFLKPSWFATTRWQTFILNRSFLTRLGVDFLSTAQIIWRESSPGMTWSTTSENDGDTNNSDLGFSPLLQFTLASQLTRDLILPVCIISYLYDLIINPAYFGYYDPFGGKPPGPFVFLWIKELHIMILGTKLPLIWRIHAKYLLHDGSRSS